MSEKEIKLTGIKKAMSKQMIRCWTEVPQFHLETEVACEPMIEYRGTLKTKCSYTAILARALGVLLPKYPDFLSSFMGDTIVEHDQVDLGIATDTKRGLLVPVIRNVDKKTVEEIQEDLNILKEKSVKGFSMEEMSGATFTLSNLGMHRINFFSAIVNVPQSAILSVGHMRTVPVVRNDEIVIGKIMHPVLNIDHRVSDGATGAKFLTEFAELLEHPEKL